MIDAIAASCVLTFLWNGWHSGSAFQFGQTVTIFMAALIARAVTLPLARFLASTYGMASPDQVIGVAFLGAFAALYLLLWISVLNLTQEMRNFHQRGPGDRFLGALIGAVRGALLATIVSIGVLTYTFDRTLESPSALVEQSHSSPYALRFDFLSPFADKFDEEMRESEVSSDTQKKPWEDMK